MPQQRWECEICCKAGRVLYSNGADVFGVIHLIEDDHQKISPGCPQPVEGIKVPLEPAPSMTQWEGYKCGFCNVPFSSLGDLYAHQSTAHDPDGILFSELGLPK